MTSSDQFSFSKNVGVACDSLMQCSTFSAIVVHLQAEKPKDMILFNYNRN